MKESNPYRPPALTGALGAKLIATPVNRTQAFFGSVVFVGHLFFWAMLLTWVEMWLSRRSPGPLPLRDLTMLKGGFVCVVTSGVTLFAVLRRMKFLSMAATVGTVAAFTIVLFLDWYG